MGSCLSKTGLCTHSKKKNPNLKQDPSINQGPNGVGPSPPPPSPPEEEAVVKEVLTETPKPSAATTRSNSRRADDSKARSPNEGDDPAATPGGCDGDDGSEDASELCSVSECFSVSTTLTEKRGEALEETEAGEEETSAFALSAAKWSRPPEWSPAGKGQGHHQWKRSASGELPPKRDARVGGAAGAGARSSPSPVKRRGGRSYTGNGNSAAGIRRDNGDRSGRRSVSPAAKRVADLRAAGGAGGVSRSPSMRKAGIASPRRPRPVPSGTAAGSTMLRTAAAEEREGEGNGKTMPSPGPKESVENPLVSLECFIFL